MRSGGRPGAEAARCAAAHDPSLGCFEGFQGRGGAHLRKCCSRSEAGLRRGSDHQRCIIALAKAFAEQGIKDGVQVKSVVPGAVMTGRRRSFLDKWAPTYGMSVEEATKLFPEQAGIARYGEPEEIAGLMAYLVSKEARWLTGLPSGWMAAKSKGSSMQRRAFLATASLSFSGLRATRKLFWAELSTGREVGNSY